MYLSLSLYIYIYIYTCYEGRPFAHGGAEGGEATATVSAMLRPVFAAL